MRPKMSLYGGVWGIAAIGTWAIALAFWWSESSTFGGWAPSGSIWRFDVLIPAFLFTALLTSAIAYRNWVRSRQSAPRSTLLALAVLFALPSLPALFLSRGAKFNSSFEVFLEWRLSYVGTLAFVGLVPLLLIVFVRRPSMRLLLRSASCVVAAAFLVSVGAVMVGYATQYASDGENWLEQTGGIAFPLMSVALPLIAVAIVFRLTSVRVD